MSLTIDLPPDLKRSLEQHAARIGNDVGAFVPQAVKEKIEKIDQELALAQEIGQVLRDDRKTPELSEEFKREILRRAAEMEAHPERSLTWEQIRTSAERQKCSYR